MEVHNFGRKESKVISMRLPVDMLVEVDRVARETGRTRNEIMQLCLEFALENMIIEEHDTPGK